MGNPSQAPMGGSPAGGGKAGLAGMMRGGGMSGGPQGLIMPEIPGINNNKHLTPSTGTIPSPSHLPGGLDNPAGDLANNPTNFVNSLLTRLLRKGTHEDINTHSY
jgi:hypothetical protein